MSSKKLIASLVMLVCVISACTKQVQSDSGKINQIDEMYREYKQEFFPNELEISAKEVKALNEPLVIVDIRDKQEQVVSMLPGAITQAEFERNLEKYKAEKIILYCTIGNRSGKYAKKLREQGIEAYNLIGGILAWAWAEQPLINENGLTQEVHVYGPRWNLLPESHTGTW